jgi:LacI family transcriptional regulator
MAVTIHDVAKKAEVAVGTVSRFLNGYQLRAENRVRIEHAIQELGFKGNIMARGLKRSRSMTIAVVAPDFSSFVAAIIPIIEQTIEAEGYSLITCNFRNEREKLRQKLLFLRERFVDGIILFPANLATESVDIVQQFLTEKIPVVFIDHLVPGIETDAIVVDNENASFRAVERLILEHHDKIAIVDGPNDSYVSQERLRGYYEAMQTYNLSAQDEWIQQGTFTQSGGYYAVKQLCAAPQPPTALYVANYEMTIGAILALHEMHLRIPEDVSFIGFDHFEAIDVVEPPLTVVEQPIERMGQLAAQLILKRIQGDYTEFPAIVKLNTKMTIRNSVRSLI